jgi:hypothetical protein
VQQIDNFGAYGGGRLLRIAADRMQRAAEARRREREAAVRRVAAGIGGHAGQVGAAGLWARLSDCARLPSLRNSRTWLSTRASSSPLMDPSPAFSPPLANP